MTRYALLKAIYTHKAEWNAYLAKSLDDDKTPYLCKGSLNVLETWEQPAECRMEAVAALEFALEMHEVGNSDIIAGMMKATLGWLKLEARRRAAE